MVVVLYSPKPNYKMPVLFQYTVVLYYSLLQNHRLSIIRPSRRELLAHRAPLTATHLTHKSNIEIMNQSFHEAGSVQTSKTILSTGPCRGTHQQKEHKRPSFIREKTYVRHLRAVTSMTTHSTKLRAGVDARTVHRHAVKVSMVVLGLREK